MHKTHQASPFTEPERYDVVLGGWRCDLRCAWLRRERLIQRIHRQPSWLAHCMPASWSRPAAWVGLGELVLKAEHPAPLTVELGGQAESRRFQAETVVLTPGERACASQSFYSLATLHVPCLPEGRVGVYSPQLRRSCLVPQRGWGDVWLRGVEVILAGWMPRAEFLRRARFLPAGSRVLQAPCTASPCLALSVAELYPFTDLFSRAQVWQASREK